jgi:hypothetical protein
MQQKYFSIHVINSKKLNVMKKLFLTVSACLCTLLATSQAHLPLSCESGPWKTPAAAGFTASELGNDYGEEDFTCATFASSSAFLQVHFEEAPSVLTFRLRSRNATSAFTFTISESDDGEEWTSVKTFRNLSADDGEKISSVSANYSLVVCPLKSATRYVKWGRTTGAASIYLYDLQIAGTPEIVAPSFLSLSAGSTSKTLIENGTSIAPNANTSLFLKFDKVVSITDPQQISLSDGDNPIAISPYFYSNSDNPLDNADNLYFCTSAEKEIRISKLNLESGHTYTLAIPAGNVRDIYGNALTGDISITFSVSATSGLDSLSPSPEIIRTVYYTLTGNEIMTPLLPGIYIRKIIYSNGKTSLTKFMQRN